MLSSAVVPHLWKPTRATSTVRDVAPVTAVSKRQGEMWRANFEVSSRAGRRSSRSWVVATFNSRGP